MSPIIGSRGFGRWSVAAIGDAGGPWWYGTFDFNSGNYNTGNSQISLASDDVGNIYMQRQGQNTSYYPQGIVTSVANDGTLRWTRGASIDNKGGLMGFKSAAVGTSAWAGSNAYFYRLATDGTSYGVLYGDNTSTNSVGCYPTSNPNKIMVKYMHYYGGDYREGVALIDTSTSTVHWGKTNYGGAGYNYSQGMWEKNSYYYYYNPAYGIVTKYNVSGTVIQSRFVNIGLCKLMGVDDSDNVYVSKTDGFAKYDSSLLPVWGVSISPSPGGNTNYYASSIALDSSGNSYHVTTSNSGTTKFYVAKVNSSGVVQWTRTLTFSLASNTQYEWDFTISKNNDLVFAAKYNTYPWTNSAYVIKLPNDGTKTGSYYPWTWAATSGYTYSSYTPTQSVASYDYNNSTSIRGSGSMSSDTGYFSKSDIA